MLHHRVRLTVYLFAAGHDLMLRRVDELVPLAEMVSVGRLCRATLSRLVPYFSRLKSRISRIVAQKRESNTPHLVHDVGDDAVHLGAERLVRRDVRVATRRQDPDQRGLAVGGACHVVERAVVLAVERPRGRVGGYARVARLAQDVARPLGGGGQRGGGEREHGGQHLERWWTMCRCGSSVVVRARGAARVSQGRGRAAAGPGRRGQPAGPPAR
eukprot:SAG31_NODE_3931_length_3742_cov_2.127917_1_plen_213_part_10